MGPITRNDWLCGIALGLASLTLLPESAIAQARYAELLNARDMVWKAWFANDQATLERILPKEAIAINNGQRKWEHCAEILESAKQFAASGGRLIQVPGVPQRFSSIATDDGSTQGGTCILANSNLERSSRVQLTIATEAPSTVVPVLRKKSVAT